MNIEAKVGVVVRGQETPKVSHQKQEKVKKAFSLESSEGLWPH